MLKPDLKLFGRPQCTKEGEMDGREGAGCFYTCPGVTYNTAPAVTPVVLRLRDATPFHE